MSATEAESRPQLVLVVEAGPRSSRLLASIERFNAQRIPVVSDAQNASPMSVLLAAETVFVRDFGYDDFLDENGELIVFWSADRDRRAAVGRAEYDADAPDRVWREPNLLDLRGLPVGYSLRGATESDIARGYVGYIGDLPSAIDADPLASLPAAELVMAASLRMYGKAPRVQRLVRRLSRRD